MNIIILLILISFSIYLYIRKNISIKDTIKIRQPYTLASEKIN